MYRMVFSDCIYCVPLIPLHPWVPSAPRYSQVRALLIAGELEAVGGGWVFLMSEVPLFCARSGESFLAEGVRAVLGGR